jgi:hypothetical protein
MQKTLLHKNPDLSNQGCRGRDHMVVGFMVLMHSVPITTNVVTSNPAQAMCTCRAHQTRRSGRLLRLGFNEIAQFLSKSKVLVPLSVVFFSPIIILFLQYSHKRSSHVPEM